MNRQQLYFIQNLFFVDKKQAETITINVTDKQKEKFKIEVYPNKKGKFLPYRLIFKNGSYTSWNTFNDLEDIENCFKMWALLN